jgi:acyl dehydratase
LKSYDDVLAHRRIGKLHTYDTSRVQLYGVGIGLGKDPRDTRQLAFLRDDDPVVIPSFATVAAWDIGFTLELGVDWSKLIHASQRLRIFDALPSAADLSADTRIKAAFDKPAGNATLLVTTTELTLAPEGRKVAELESISLARDFRVAGAPEGRPERLPSAPCREPDHISDFTTSAQVALIYRLLGGRSEIHFDPQVATDRGFDGPIMHGLCTWGHACHVVLAAACDFRAEHMTSFAADFSAPVYPGETLRTRLWFEQQQVWFETTALERDVVVLANGYSQLSVPAGA